MGAALVWEQRKRLAITDPDLCLDFLSMKDIRAIPQWRFAEGWRADPGGLAARGLVGGLCGADCSQNLLHLLKCLLFRCAEEILGLEIIDIATLGDTTVGSPWLRYAPPWHRWRFCRLDRLIR